jgi:hypothetical protein
MKKKKEIDQEDINQAINIGQEIYKTGWLQRLFSCCAKKNNDK